MLPEIFGLTKKITMQMKMVCTLVTKHQKADGYNFFGSCLLFSRLTYIQKKGHARTVDQCTTKGKV